MANMFSAMAMAAAVTALVPAWVSTAQADEPQVQLVNARLHGTRWQLVSIEGQAVPPALSAQMVLRPGSERLEARTSCAPLAGRYEQRGIQLVFTVPDGITEKSGSQPPCGPEAVAQQARFLEMLGRSDAYRIEGKRLSLLRDNTVLARFMAKGR